MRFALQKGHNSNRKKSTGRHRITQNAMLNPLLKNALRKGGRIVSLSRTCDKESPLTRNRVPISSAVSASRRNTASSCSFCPTLNWQYLCKAAVILPRRSGSMLSFGRKIVVLTFPSCPQDAKASLLFINSMPETKCALFEKGSSAGRVKRSWMFSR